MKMLLAVAMGGAVGATGRYLVMGWVGQWLGHGFPWGTFTVNLLGSFVLGALVEISALAWSPSPELRAFLVVGVMGAFTTFSTFSLDAVTLIERGDLGPAAGYVLGSVVLCVLGFWAGLALFRQVL
ncbi:MAG: fluoride efflux transporter CrcB [Rhodospirillaceae bacterium]|nr:fluoride efflux transporter CrcB [Rhodospirillaceae bacterium]|tara:strand:+ start:419 stop:796 length:378 start_codon:yes stop_codon:yes gene_type:complete